MTEHKNDLHGTTILSIRKNGKVVIIADGQVSFGPTIMKATAKKLRTIANGKIYAGFAGSTADALTLFERLESKVEKYSNQLTRACVELAKDWRTDRYLRKLEAMMIVVDKDNTFILTGNGDVLEPENGIAAIGSGGNYALSAALAMIDIDNLDAEQIAKRAMKIAGDMCVYTNHNLTMEIIEND
jgi:ATP-dependent HslUV protease, peptidase subunit HslV